MESPTDSTNSIEANDPALHLLDSIHRIPLGFIDVTPRTPGAAGIAWRSAFIGQPITNAAAKPMIGDISGATNMAPITTAVLSASKPSTAIVTDIHIRDENRHAKYLNSGPSWNKLLTILRRSASGTR